MLNVGHKYNYTSWLEKYSLFVTNWLELAIQIYITITVSCDPFPLCICFQNRHSVFSTISCEQHIAKKTLISFITGAKFQNLIKKKPFSFQYKVLILLPFRRNSIRKKQDNKLKYGACYTALRKAYVLTHQQQTDIQTFFSWILSVKLHKCISYMQGFDLYFELCYL